VLFVDHGVEALEQFAVGHPQIESGAGSIVLGALCGGLAWPPADALLAASSSSVRCCLYPRRSDLRPA